MKSLLPLLLALSAAAMAEPQVLLGNDMPGKSHQGPLPPATAQQRQLAVRLRVDVEHLAGKIGERNSRVYPKLLQSRDWVQASLQQAGYRVNSQHYTIMGRQYTNLECEKKGASSDTVIIGAHYDSALNCPAANDNASGVAAMLALARHLKKEPKMTKTVRFAAFVNEEPPYFVKETMGSSVYARHCQKRGDKISAMLSLETMGYYSDAPNSQKVPPLLGSAFPKVGNFIAFISNPQSGELVKSCVGSFRKHAAFPSQGGALPANVPGVGWSDHWSFWQIGVPAVMVTDTAPFRYPHYHMPEDTPDKIDYLKLARVVVGLQGVVADLAR